MALGRYNKHSFPFACQEIMGQIPYEQWHEHREFKKLAKANSAEAMASWESIHYWAPDWNSVLKAKPRLHVKTRIALKHDACDQNIGE